MAKQTIDDCRINRVAAMMAISNYGQRVDVERVLNWKPSKRWGNTPRSEICDLAGHFMETESHEDMFADEAEGWAKQIHNTIGGLKAFAAQFPHDADTIHKIMEIDFAV